MKVKNLQKVNKVRLGLLFSKLNYSVNINYDNDIFTLPPSIKIKVDLDKLNIKELPKGIEIKEI